MAYRSINAHDYDPEWLMSYVDTITSDCWLWNGSMYQNGYGKYGKRGKMAHRIFYTLFVGAVSEDMALDHLCRNRRCVNPDHLEIVTLVENVMRGNSQHAINARKSHCKQGHEFTPDNTYIPQKRLNRRYCKECIKVHSKNHIQKLRTQALII